MGARINFVFKQDESGNNVTLYSHWGEGSWEEDLAYAIGKARPRWTDPSYATRIVVSQLINEEWESETGYGLHVTNESNDLFFDKMVTIDFVNQTIEGKPFDKFVEYHKEETHA